MARSYSAAFVFLGTLFLVLSHTQMVARAQQVTVQAPAGAAGATTTGDSRDQMVAKLLTSVFTDIGNDLGVLGNNATAGNSTLGASLRAALSQQQSLADIQPLKNAADSLAAFFNLPLTFGTGDNIKLFLKQVKQFKALADMLDGQIDGIRLTQIRGYLDRATQLALQAVAAFPLADLAFATAQVALASAIIGLTASIFFVVGSSLLVSAQITGLAAAGGGGPGRTAVSDSQWFKDISAKAADIRTPVLALAFNPTSLGMLDLADNLLGVGQGAFNLVGVSAPAA